MKLCNHQQHLSDNKYQDTTINIDKSGLETL